jgi:hypothetical protein
LPLSGMLESQSSLGRGEERLLRAWTVPVTLLGTSEVDGSVTATGSTWNTVWTWRPFDLKSGVSPPTKKGSGEETGAPNIKKCLLD